MKPIYIEKKRIRKLSLPKEFDTNKIHIGIPVKSNENEVLNLKNTGDMIIPSPDFGANCRKNACGYTYLDTESPKKRRYVSTVWMQPFGNPNATSIPVDIYKKCYPQVFVNPTEIELCFYQNDNNEKFIIAMLDEELRDNYLKETVNIFLEIYGYCYIFANDIKIVDIQKYERCNWEILPPGTRPSAHIKKQAQSKGEEVNGFSFNRLLTIEKHNPIKSVQGTNGFTGYFAYVFEDFCVLESAKYGNATYVIPSENWEVISQKTKKELFDEKYVLNKFIHNSNWELEIESIF